MNIEERRDGLLVNLRKGCDWYTDRPMDDKGYEGMLTHFAVVLRDFGFTTDPLQAEELHKLKTALRREGIHLTTTQLLARILAEYDRLLAERDDYKKRWEAKLAHWKQAEDERDVAMSHADEWQRRTVEAVRALAGISTGYCNLDGPCGCTRCDASTLLRTDWAKAISKEETADG